MHTLLRYCDIGGCCSLFVSSNILYFRAFLIKYVYDIKREISGIRINVFE